MARRIVAFVDVLGFKSLVENVPQPTLVEIYRRLQDAARLQTARPVFPEDHRRFDEDAYYEDAEIQRARVVNVVMASDSIVVYASGDSHKDAMAVAAAVRGLIVAGFRDGVALRGAIAIGELDEVDLADDAVNRQNWTARFSGLVGLGLVRAYELEEGANWSGAVIHPDLVAHLEATTVVEHAEGPLSALDLFSFIRLAVQTEVPIKRRDSHGEPVIQHETHWAIDWPFLADSVDWRISEQQVVASFASFGRSALSAEVEAKRGETIAFMARAEADAEATQERRRRLWRH
jgi:hypothetical protein